MRLVLGVIVLSCFKAPARSVLVVLGRFGFCFTGTCLGTFSSLVGPVLVVPAGSGFGVVAVSSLGMLAESSLEVTEGSGLGVLVGLAVWGESDFGVLGSSVASVDGGLGLVGWRAGLGKCLGAVMERMEEFLWTEKGLAVRRGLGAAAGLEGSKARMRGPSVAGGGSTRPWLLESDRGLRCKRPPETPTSPIFTWADIPLHTPCRREGGGVRGGKALETEGEREVRTEL